MIFNASNAPLNTLHLNLPNLGLTIVGWFQDVVIGIITKTVVNGRCVETVLEITTKGVKQPFTAEQLAILPEGERSWKWYMLHCQASLALNTDDVITIRGTRYRVMSRLGYDEYGFLQYELVDDYTTTIPPTP